MPRWWKRMRLWQRVLLLLYVPVLFAAIGTFVFGWPFMWWVLVNFVLLVLNVVLTQRDNARARRDGSYWGPRD